MFLLPLQTPEKCFSHYVFRRKCLVHDKLYIECFFPFGLRRNCLIHCRKCFFHYRLSKNCFFNYKFCRNCFYLCLNVSTIKKKTLQILFRPLRTLRKVCYHYKLHRKCFFHDRLYQVFFFFIKDST